MLSRSGSGPGGRRGDRGIGRCELRDVVRKNRTICRVDFPPDRGVIASDGGKKKCRGGHAGYTLRAFQVKVAVAAIDNLRRSAGPCRTPRMGHIGPTADYAWTRGEPSPRRSGRYVKFVLCSRPLAAYRAVLNRSCGDPRRPWPATSTSDGPVSYPSEGRWLPVLPCCPPGGHGIAPRVPTASSSRAS